MTLQAFKNSPQKEPPACPAGLFDKIICAIQLEKELQKTKIRRILKLMILSMISFIAMMGIFCLGIWLGRI